MTNSTFKKAIFLLLIFVSTIVVSILFLTIGEGNKKNINVQKKPDGFDVVVAYCSSDNLYPGEYASQYNRLLETSILSEEDKYLFADFICTNIKDNNGSNPNYDVYFVIKDNQDLIYVTDNEGNNKTFNSNLKYSFSEIIIGFERQIGFSIDLNQSNIIIDFLNLIVETEEKELYNTNYSYLNSNSVGIPKINGIIQNELEKQIDNLNYDYSSNQTFYTKKIYAKEEYRDKYLNKKIRYEAASSISFEYYQLVYNGKVYVLQMADYLYSTGEFEVYVQ